VLRLSNSGFATRVAPPTALRASPPQGRPALASRPS